MTIRLARTLLHPPRRDDWNAEGRYQGSKDIPLNDVGRGQADLNGRLLAQILERAGRSPKDFAWYASPLGRTRETMERVRKGFDVELPPVQFDDRLVEVSFGIYEGRLHAELASGEMAIAGERDADFWFFRPPEGESYEDVATRIVDFAADAHRPLDHRLAWRDPPHPAPADRGFPRRTLRQLVPAAGFGGAFQGRQVAGLSGRAQLGRLKHGRDWHMSRHMPVEAPVNQQRQLRTASIFRNGRNQAVRIPVEFELPGDEVTIEQDGDALIIRPKKATPKTFAELFSEWEAFPDFPDVDDSTLPPDIDR